MFRRQNQNLPQEESENIFVSMTDLTVSLLLIVLVILGVFAVTLGQSVRRAELETVQREIDTLKMQNVFLVDDLRDANSQLVSEAEALKMAQNSGAVLEGRIDELEGENFSLLRQLKLSKQLRNNLETLYSLANSREAVLSARVDELSDRLSIVVEKSSNLASDMLTSEGFLRTTKSQLRAEIERGNKLAATLAQLAGQNDSLLSEHALALADRNWVILSLQRKLNVVYSDVRHLRDILVDRDTQLAGAIKTLSAAQRGFEARLASVTEELEDQRQKMNRQREIILSYRDDLQAMELLLVGKDKELKVSNVSYTELTAALSASEDKLVHLRTDLGSARAEIEVASKRLDEQDAMLQELTERSQNEASGNVRVLSNMTGQLTKLRSEFTMEVARAERAEANLALESEEVRLSAEALRSAAQVEARLRGELVSLASKLSSQDATLQFISRSHAEAIRTLQLQFLELRVASEMRRVSQSETTAELLRLRADYRDEILRFVERLRQEQLERAKAEDELGRARDLLTLREAEIEDQLIVLDVVRSEVASAEVSIKKFKSELKDIQADRTELKNVMSAYLDEIDKLQIRNQKLDALRIRLEVDAVRLRDLHAEELAKLNADLAVKSEALKYAQVDEQADKAARDKLRVDFAAALAALAYERSERRKAEVEVAQLQDLFSLAEETAREDLEQLNQARAELIANLASVNQSNIDLHKLAKAAKVEGLGNAELLSQLAYLLEMEGQSPNLILSTVDKLKQFYLSADEEAFRLRRELQKVLGVEGACQQRLNDTTARLGRANKDRNQCGLRLKDLVTQLDDAELAVRLLQGTVVRMNERSEINQ